MKLLRLVLACGGKQKEPPLTMQKTIAVVGRALALVILSPVSALAKADRAVEGTGSGTISIDPLSGAFSGDVTGVVSHLGNVTVRMEGTGAPTPEGTFTGTIVAANGDRLTGTFTLTTTELLPAGHTTTVVITITGGTGRFADASGTLTVVCLTGPATPVGPLLYSSLECKVTGRISY